MIGIIGRPRHTGIMVGMGKKDAYVESSGKAWHSISQISNRWA